MKRSQGFTAVELIITLVVGMLLLITAYQLYSFVINDSAQTRMKASASNLAYRFMREHAGIVSGNPCTMNVTTPYTSSIPASAQLPSNAEASVTIECINNGVPMQRITSKITYGNGKTVTHATYLPTN